MIVNDEDDRLRGQRGSRRKKRAHRPISWKGVWARRGLTWEKKKSILEEETIILPLEKQQGSYPLPSSRKKNLEGGHQLERDRRFSQGMVISETGDRGKRQI